MIEDGTDFASEETRYDGGRSLLRTQAVGVGRSHHARLEQAVVPVDGGEGVHDEGYEAQVVPVRLSWSHERGSRVGPEGPVAVLAGSVHALEGFLMQENAEAVLARDLLHQGHQHHVVIDGDVAFLINGSKFELVRSHFIVAGLGRYAELVGLDLKVFHERGDAFGDGPEIMVVELLALRALVSHQGAPRKHEIRTGEEKILIHEEIFLLPSKIGMYLVHALVEKAADGGCGLVHGADRLEQRGLVVQGLSCI